MTADKDKLVDVAQTITDPNLSKVRASEFNMNMLSPSERSLLTETLKLSGSPDQAVAIENQRKLAKALELPLKMGEFDDDEWSSIYESIPMENEGGARFPLDFVTPGTESDFIAYVMPRQGAVPQRHVEGDEVLVHTFEVANSVDWLLRYARDARWDVVARAVEVFRSGVTLKINQDAWRTLVTAAANRGLMVTDPAATSGSFTPKLIARMKTAQKRSAIKHKLTDLYVSPEAFEDIRAWTQTEVDDLTRRDIFLIKDRTDLMNIYGVTLHEQVKLGQKDGATGQEYQAFFLDNAGGTLGSGDVELVIGIDKTRSDSFVRPVIQELQMFEDPTLHRSRKAGFYGWLEHGLAVLDATRVASGSF